MRILLVTQDFPPVRGGIQTYCHRLALGLHALGHQIQVVCPNHPEAEALDRDLPFPVVRLRCHSSFLWFPLLSRMGKLVRDFQPQVLLYGQWQNGLWNLLPGNSAARAIPQATLVHGRELLDSAFLRATRLLARPVLRRMQLAIPNSHPVRDILLALRPVGDTVIAYPGVDPERFAGADAQLVRQRLGWNAHKVAGVVTRLVPRKNIAALLRAAAALRGKHPELRILVGGDGPDRTHLQETALRLGLMDICHFSGSVAQNELAAHFAALDVLVMPSLSAPRDIEGFGIVYLEAGSLGIPTLAYAAGGVVDAVANGESGVLVTQGDELALQQELTRLLQDNAWRQRLGEGARARAHQLTWAANAETISVALQRIGLARSGILDP